MADQVGACTRQLWHFKVLPVTLIVLLRSASGQGVDSLPKFEAASVKLSSTGGSWTRETPGRIDFHNVSLQFLLRRAYSVAPYQIAGPKGWNIARLDVVAIFPSDVRNEKSTLMLRSLLAERLRLNVHRETRELPVYALTVAKGGLRMSKAQSVADSGGTDAGQRVSPFRISVDAQSNRHLQGRLSIFELITQVSSGLDRPLIDNTGLEGEYVIDLEWLGMPSNLFGHVEPRGSGQASDPAGSSIASLFSALEKRLGLHVDPRKAPVEMLVIDHVEKTPVEN